MSGVITGSEEHKEKLRKQFLGQRGANTELTATSRRLHVATSARESACHHLMYGRLGNEGIGRRTTRGTDFHSQRIQTSRDCPGFVPFPVFVKDY